MSKVFAQLCFLASLLLPCASPSLRAEPVSDDGLGWQLIRLDLDVTIAEGSDHLELAGRAWVRLDLEASTGPTLGMRSPMRFVEVEASDGAKIDVNAPHPRLDNVVLAHVRYDEPLHRGDVVQLDFSCRSEGSSATLRVTDRAAFTRWTSPWYPVTLPTPDDNTTRTYKAPGRTTFHLPTKWSAVSNGVRIQRSQSKSGATDVWETKRALARSFAAGPYEVGRHQVNGREVGVYLLTAKPTSAEKQAKTLVSALTALEERFGDYPFESLAIAEIPDDMAGWVAASQQGFILAREVIFEAVGGNIPLFAHEAAHAWWGNLVSTKMPGAMVCSESLAQYGAVIAIESIEGRDKATEFLNYSRDFYIARQSARGLFEMLNEGKDAPLAELKSGSWQHDFADAKGHWVFHMLREHIGDDLFFSTFRRVIERFSNDAMSLSDLRQSFIDAAPDMQLPIFFEQWFDRKGAPVLEFDWWMAEDGESVRMEIEQQQAGEPYVLQLELELEQSDGSTRIETVNLNQSSQSFTINTENPIRSVRLDPEYKLLIWRPEYGPRPLASR